MKRHLIRIFMTVLIVAGLFSAAAFADDPPTVIASGTCGTNATWTLDSEGTLTISGSGEMDNNYSDMYGSNPAPWIVDYRNAIKKVVIDGGITSISCAAFAYCDQLSQISIADSVIIIWDEAFNECTSLQEVILPDSVTTIETLAFESCSSLRNVRLSANLAVLNYKAFESCTSLKSITIPGSLTTISGALFQGCTSLEQIILSDGVEKIEGYAFMGCTSLTGVVFPSSLKTIGNSAFSRCTSLTEIVIPANVTTIGDYAFSGCSSLSVIKVDSENSSYCTVKGALLNKAKTELVLVPATRSGRFTIPYGVTAVHPNAFYKCGINAVIIPKTVNSIQQGAFFECNSLQDVYYLGTSTDWQSVTINTSLTDATMHYPQYSGTCGTSATWSLFNDGLLVISGTGAMTNYSSDSSRPWGSYLSRIKSIIVDHGITRIGNNAFNGSYAESLAIEDASLTMGEYSVFNNQYLTSIDFGAGTIIPSNNVFVECNALEFVHIPANVVMDGTFYDDGSGYGMFYSCRALKTAVVDCAYVGPYVFERDRALESVIFTDPDVRFYYLECDPRKGDPFNDVIGTSSEPIEFDVIGYTCSSVPTLLSSISSYGRTIHFVPIEGDPGHRDVVIDAAVEATCETDGLTEGSHCAACGKVFTSQQTIPALGHDWGEWTVARAATCAAEGEEQRTCSHDASHVEMRSIEKLPHDPADMVVENTVNPTCTEAGGYDEVIYCNACNEELSREPKTVEPLGHDYRIIYDWEDDNSSVTAIALCRRDSSHFITETVTVASEVTKPATEYEMGETTYTAMFASDVFETQTKTVADIDMLPHTVIKGDADGDGIVNAIDRVLLSKYLAGWSGIAEQILDINAMDINNDSKVNAKDRVILSRYLAKWGGEYDHYFE